MAMPGVLWLALFFLTPFYAILAVAMGRLHPIFNTAVPVWNPLEWQFYDMRSALSDMVFGQLRGVLLRTLVYVFVATGLSILIGYPVAYYVSRRAGRWRNLLLMLLVAPFWINYLMRMIAWQGLLARDGLANKALVLLRLLPSPIDWLSGRHETVVLGLVYGYIPWFILPLFAALDRIDKSVLEAARDLGANSVRTFLRVTLPLSWQGILAGTVIIMLPMFGDYYTPDLMSGSPKTSLIGNQIDFFIHTQGGPKGAAITLFLMLLVAVLMLYYLFSVARASREATR